MENTTGPEHLAARTPTILLACATIFAAIFYGKSSAQDPNSDTQAIFERHVTATDMRRPNEILHEIHTQSPFYLLASRLHS